MFRGVIILNFKKMNDYSLKMIPKETYLLINKLFSILNTNVEKKRAILSSIFEDIAKKIGKGYK